MLILNILGLLHSIGCMNVERVSPSLHSCYLEIVATRNYWSISKFVLKTVNIYPKKNTTISVDGIL